MRFIRQCSFIEALITAMNSRLFLTLYTAARSAATGTSNSHAPELDYFSEHEFDDVRSVFSEVDVGPISYSRPGSSKGLDTRPPPGYDLGMESNAKGRGPKGAKKQGSFGEPLGEVFVMTERATKAM